jgi:UV DNA damage repair endonuclease
MQHSTFDPFLMQAVTQHNLKKVNGCENFLKALLIKLFHISSMLFKQIMLYSYQIRSYSIREEYRN